MPLAASAQIHQKRDTAKVAKEMSLNPVVVTGSGHHQRLVNAITPVHVISAKEIEEQGITTFADALIRTMPQLSMAPNSMGSQLRLNGLSGKYILVLVNGRKLSGEMSNNADLQRINMARVKRIEVLDGAASSLYGSDAIAGVINVITDYVYVHTLLFIKLSYIAPSYFTLSPALYAFVLSGCFHSSIVSPVGSVRTSANNEGATSGAQLACAV